MDWLREGLTSLVVLQGGLPGIPPAFVTLVVQWILNIAGGLGVLFLVWSFVQQLPPGKRDWSAMAFEIIGTLMLLLIISRSQEVTRILLSAMGVPTALTPSSLPALGLLLLPHWRGVQLAQGRKG